MKTIESLTKSHMKTTNTIKAKNLSLLTAIGLVGVIAGCTTPSGRPDYTANGALIGGASGAAIGALADRRAPGAGALIGGAAGLVAGGLVGHTMDRQSETAPPPTYSYAPPPPPTEPVVAAPGPGYEWVDGEWVWNGATWVWV